jgi:Fic family protein
MTQKSGSMEFGILLDKGQRDIQELLTGIHYTQRAYKKLPKAFPRIAENVYKAMIVSSIFSTTNIEGAALESEEAVAEVLAMPPDTERTVKEQPTTNMRLAYHYASNQAKAPGFMVTEEHIKEVHAIVTRDLPISRNVPGHYRKNPRDVPTYVGHERVGGIYRPPKTHKDIEDFMGGLIEWLNFDEVRKEDPLIIAPIVHLYFELIHPFWDGNGRVGRVLEAMVLESGTYRHAPFRMAKYYNDNVEEYFSLFSDSRKAMQKKDPNAHYAFVKFFLVGFLETIEELYDKVINILTDMACRDYFRIISEQKFINRRQYVILLEVMNSGFIKKGELESQAWYKAIYHDRTRSTRLRDLRMLKEKELLVEKDGKYIVFPEEVVS